MRGVFARAATGALRRSLARLVPWVVLSLSLLTLALHAAPVRADDASLARPRARFAESADVPHVDAPYAPLVRQHYYAQLAKNPWRALGWEALLPGAGNLYVGLRVPAAMTLGLSALGAGLWVAGATMQRGAGGRAALLWTGVGTLAAARAYGLVSAPIGAALLNAAFRAQLGVSGVY
ncbi:MAG: hypothetical protein RLZZ450_6245 [Pseudomonadota bacterium]|jgi:hypothetical protein